MSVIAKIIVKIKTTTPMLILQTILVVKLPLKNIRVLFFQIKKILKIEKPLFQYTKTTLIVNEPQVIT